MSTIVVNGAPHEAQSPLDTPLVHHAALCHRRQRSDDGRRNSRRGGLGIGPYGLSHALLEEARFDESGITSRDWLSYPILKMADVPEIKVALINRPAVGTYDATGKAGRRLPLRPEDVRSLLKT